ncbi:MAG: hypothetical protein PWP39_1257 [Pyrococcus sp.]|nr:hypothetical protein [Pyrococcus sp.]
MKNLFLGPGPGFEPGPGDPQSPVLTRLHHPGHSHRKFWNRFIKFSSDSGDTVRITGASPLEATQSHHQADNQTENET